MVLGIFSVSGGYREAVTAEDEGLLSQKVCGTSGGTPRQPCDRIVAVDALDVASADPMRECEFPASERQFTNEIFDKSGIVVGNPGDSAFIWSLDDRIHRA